MSGIVVGIVALPLAIAFAIASGVSPEKGLITAIVAGLTISIFGGSKVQIGGPTGAFIVIVFGIVQQHGVGGLIIATFLAGFLLIALGLVRAGKYLRFIPHPLIIGFTSGIAVVIFSSQINELLGLGIDHIPAGFVEKWRSYTSHINSLNIYALGIAAGTIIITASFHRLSRMVPGSIIAILLSTIAVYVFHLPVDTIESRFGEIPGSLSLPVIPEVDFNTMGSLIRPAITIALLGAIESLLSAVVADGMIGGRHRPNIELVAQGGANIISAMFGGIPATGAIARTATNIRNGGRTPVAGIVHALTLLIIMIALAPYAKLIPLSCLAGILSVVAYNMSEWRQFVSILRSRNLEILILLTTFLLTIIFDLVLAIEIGLLLSCFLFMKRMSDTFLVQGAIVNHKREDELFQQELNYPADKVTLYEINGPLFFGAAQQFADTLTDLRVKPGIIILRMRYVPFIDATGYHRLKEVIRSFEKQETCVLISGVSEELMKDFEVNNLFTYVKQERVFKEIEGALNYVRSELIC
ncbi:MAG: SulP family inorganic anion transporter [Flavobacteriales bacterium]|nr:SulP family inorganic anion transporter [Flavobacteriales bacterium]